MLRRSFAPPATVAAIACLTALAACSGPAAPRGSAASPAAAVTGEQRARIAQAEARRGGGLDELTALAGDGDPAVRGLALRGLGRTGGPRALAVLQAALGDGDLDVVAAAAGAIGLAASLDEPSPALAASLTPGLAGAASRLGERAPVALEALGRAGDRSAQILLARGLAGSPAVAAASAIALGRHGRRKLELEPAARAALATALGHRDPAVRYAAAYALAREAGTLAPVDALVARVTDPDAEVRAIAIAAIAKRKQVAAAREPVVGALADRDWRVAVEAVRALAGEAGDEAGRRAVATAISVLVPALAGRPARDAQIAIEALRVLAAHGDTALPALALQIPAALPALTRGWLDCLSQVAIARRAERPDLAALDSCGGGALPDHLRLPVFGGLVAAKRGPLAARRTLAARLLAHGDPRVKAAGLAALAALWPEGDATDQRAAVATLAAAVGSTDPVVAGAALEAAPVVYAGAGAGARAGDRSVLDAAIVARARSERDVELATALFDLIRQRTLAAGAPACRDGLAGHPVLARAAAACLTALGESAPAEPSVPAATAPPVDLEPALGGPLRWQLATTRGAIEIELRPDSAPWAVATIVALTRKGFYDGLELHRVVPDFVVQGGDPTQSGWGGPGFAIPAEPATGDLPGFATGGVGIADAGRDSGGSQWFVMHGRAPHLDGRYTWVGRVVAGQDAADALLIGDRVIKATVAVPPAPTN